MSSVRAHGTQTGQDTQTYTVNLTSLIPASGSLTAYVAATVSQIQQNSFPVSGPPPGHPAYDPSLVPTVAYAATVYTVALSAVSGGIDNVNTFELLRTTLTHGQSSVTGWSTAGQFRAADRDAWPPVVLASGGLLTPAQAQFMLVPASSGLTHTLPPASGAGGLMFGGTNPTAGLWTIAATGSDRITGSAPSGAASLVVPSSGAVLLWANAISGIWQILGASPNMFLAAPAPYINATSGAYTAAVPAGMTRAKLTVVGAGGGGAGCSGTQGGGGGGAGGVGIKWLTGLVPGQNISGTIGAGGAAGLSITNGSAGTATTAQVNGTGPIYTANGGNGGDIIVNTAGGFGGTAVNCDLNLSGSDGSDAPPVNSPSYGGGNGAPGYLGMGAGRAGIGAGDFGHAPGAGGGGAYYTASSGGAGAAGMALIEWSP